METIIELSLINPSDYVMWRLQVVNLAEQLGFDKHLKVSVEDLVSAYTKSKILMAGTVPVKVLEKKLIVKREIPTISKLNIIHIKQSGAKLFSLILNSLSTNFRRLASHQKTMLELLEFVEN